MFKSISFEDLAYSQWSSTPLAILPDSEPTQNFWSLCSGSIIVIAGLHVVNKGLLCKPVESYYYMPLARKFFRYPPHDSRRRTHITKYLRYLINTSNINNMRTLGTA
jgi:hypothetical protein